MAKLHSASLKVLSAVCLQTACAVIYDSPPPPDLSLLDPAPHLIHFCTSRTPPPPQALSKEPYPLSVLHQRSVRAERVILTVVTDT